MQPFIHAPVPHLRRLLLSDENITYTAKIHFLHGWPWLLAACAALAATLYLHPLFSLPLAVLVTVYLTPLRTNQIAITSRRLLYRTGRFTLALEAIHPADLTGWHLTQTPFTNALNAGQITLDLNTAAGPRTLRLPLLAHPLSFIEALETLERPRS